MDLDRVLKALRVSWWLPTLGLVVGGAAALAVSLLAVPQYTAQTQLFFSTTASVSTVEVFQGSQFSQQRVASYARLIESEDLAARVIERLDLNSSATSLAERIQAVADDETVLIDVSVVDESPARAASIADAVGTEFKGMVAELEPASSDEESLVRVSVIGSPEVPSEPSSPAVARNVALGLVLGGLIGLAVVLARVRFNRSITDPDEIADLAKSPLIGMVSRSSDLERRHIIQRDAANRSAEDFRQLRSNLQFINVDAPPKTIMVTSSLPAEGKTTLVCNLGLVLADAGHRVVIVEADLRRPKVASYLGMVGGVGLTNVLAGAAQYSDVVQQYGGSNLSVILAGPTPPNPGELLSSATMRTMLDDLKEANDFVLLDAPPLLPVADASGLAALVDGVVLCVKFGSSKRDQLQQAVMKLERVNARLLGAVLNLVPPRADIARAQGYGYDYHSG
ncbi:polysaccharide biosynthesis tyrosine autokinase [Candidatus Blastococcus massiliensis]|uniref:polysaccharide biosynthesis tyrosine autokinase n=1 Tax=Candidatus Blastococcus massiliensis TaxID=1470358 RepID=UPI00068601DD|nr:polysaccharide biosynthesis tyrosine autokinase [Candidatus Blastococcus massiliensis]